MHPVLRLMLWQSWIRIQRGIKVTGYAGFTALHYQFYHSRCVIFLIALEVWSYNGFSAKDNVSLCLVFQIPLLVFLDTQTARTWVSRGFAIQMKHRLTIFTPSGGFKLEREEDFIGVACLANKTSLSAQVTLKNVVRGVLHQCDQEHCIMALCYLS